MPSKTTLDTVAYGLLGLAATSVLLLPESLVIRTSRGGGPPPALHLTGVVRDFKASHVDFDVPAEGHYAGNVALRLDEGKRPVFTGGGRRVVTQWEDDVNRPIPSHLYGDGLKPRLAVASTFVATDTCEVDSFDSRDGPYGGANVGSEAILSIDTTEAAAVHLTGTSWFRGDVLVGQGGNPGTVINNVGRITGATGSLPQPINLPVVELPTDVGPFLGDQDFDGVTLDIDGNRHWGNTRMEGTVFRIHGNVTILVDGSFDIDDTVNDFVFMPGATLDLYCTGWMEVDNDARLNMNTGEPSRLTIYMMGTYDGSGDEEEIGLLDVEDGAQITADIVAPNGKLLLENGCDVYGTFTGDAIELTDDSRFHVDLAVFASGCASGDGPPGLTGSAGSGGIASAASFTEWFRDILGTNLATHHTVTLDRDGAGVYTYLDDEFSPIDDRLFGNEDADHNRHFTYVIDATFTYRACWGQFVEFEGGDGTWLFIDEKLVMDLGGVASGTGQHVELDRLALTDGETYRLQLFYAQRHATSSVFRLRTTLDLVTPRINLPVTAAFD